MEKDDIKTFELNIWSGTIKESIHTPNKPANHVALAFCGACHIVGGIVFIIIKYSLQGTTQGRYLTGGVPPVRFSM